MNQDKFHSALLSSAWMIDPVWGLSVYSKYISDMAFLAAGGSLRDLRGEIKQAIGEPTFMKLDGTPTQDEAGIASIYLSGLMTTDGEMGMCGRSKGVKDMVSDMEQLDRNPDVKGLLLEINSGGGAATAAFMLASGIENFSKPVVTFGHFVGSAAYMAASQSNEIVGAGQGSSFGSIGTVIQLRNEDLKQMAEDYTTLYSRLSTRKNEELRGLLSGDNKAMLDTLDGLTNAFISQVKGSRNIMDKEAFTGAMFMAKDAKKSGLIDNIGTKSKAIQILNRHIKINQR